MILLSFKVYFEYGTMGSSKSSQLLMMANNYRHKAVKTYLVKPAIDNRDSDTKIVSRVGLEHEVTYVYVGPTIDKDTGMVKVIKDAISNDGVLFIDEAQFFNYEDVRRIYTLANELSKNKNLSNFCIMAFGLLTDFNDKLFEGTKAWIEIADSLREIKNVCKFCNSKATRNYFVNHDNSNTNIVIGDSLYYPVCSYHYNLLMRYPELITQLTTN